MTAMATEECQPETMKSTPWRFTASVTALTAFSGLDWLSTQTSSTSRFLPSMVSGTSPFSRAWARASLVPFRMASPVRLDGPVNGPMMPILIGPSWARRVRGIITISDPAAPSLPAMSSRPRRLIPPFSWAALLFSGLSSSVMFASLDQPNPDRDPGWRNGWSAPPNVLSSHPFCRSGMRP